MLYEEHERRVTTVTDYNVYKFSSIAELHRPRQVNPVEDV
jgi:hypothetical protein